MIQEEPRETRRKAKNRDFWLFLALFTVTIALISLHVAVRHSQSGADRSRHATASSRPTAAAARFEPLVALGPDSLEGGDNRPGTDR